MVAISALQQPQHLMPQAVDNPLFQSAYIALRNAQHIRDLFLCVLSPAEQPEAQHDYLPLPLVERTYRLHEYVLFRVVLERAADLVLVRAEDIGQQQLVSVPKLTSVRWLPILRRYISISFSMQRLA